MEKYSPFLNLGSRNAVEAVDDSATESAPPVISAMIASAESDLQ